MMTKLISDKKLTASAMTIAKRMSIPGMLVSILIDTWHVRIYLRSGETELVLAHGLAIAGTIVGILALMAPEFSLAAMLLGSLAFILLTISFIAILHFTKNEIESWLFQGYFGMTKNQKDLPWHSIEKFHQMISVIRINKIEGQGGLVKALDQSRLYSHFMPQEIPHTELMWILELEEKTEIVLSISLFAQTKYSLEKLNSTLIKISPSQVSGTALRWEIRAPRHIFPTEGELGKMLIECHDAESGAFMGKDAYEFNYRRAPNVYEHNKVLYEQNRKTP
jgi:hypothetical protein